jgi:hypothetical protein
MNTSKKEEFLLKQGRRQETIDFCKELKISPQKFVWFCERIEKENFNIKDEKFKEYIKKSLKLLERTNLYNNVNSLEKLIRVADKNIETDEHENKRVLHKFKNGHYIINLSPKELFLEGREMSNCVRDMTYGLMDKTIAILALKDKKNKTLVHLQVNKLGFLEQHYSKANTAVSSERWKYINEFFDIYKDEQFSEKINSTNIDINYNVSNQTHNFVPVVEYFIPTKVTNSIFTPEALKINEIYHIKDFVNTTQFDKLNKGKHLSKNELFDYLNDFKNYINKSIDNILDFVNISHKNYYNLNNTMIQKIFESKTPRIEEKISNVSNEHKPKMVIDYTHAEVTGYDLEEAAPMYENGDAPLFRALGMTEQQMPIEQQIIGNDIQEECEEEMMCEEEISYERSMNFEINEEVREEINLMTDREECRLGNLNKKVEEIDFISQLKNDLNLTEKEIKSIETIIEQIENEEIINECKSAEHV